MNQDELIQIAKEYMTTICNGELAITGELINFDIGILFHYQDKVFVETGDQDYFAYGGQMYFIVNKKDGSVFHDITRPFFRDIDYITFFRSTFINNKLEKE